jgi:3-deoxy-D-manno-octulosonic-acid transferase
LWRARRQPEYLHHLGERHGFYAPRPTAPLIWLHAVSVGETRAAEPLIAALAERLPWPRAAADAHDADRSRDRSRAAGAIPDG